MRVTRKLVLGDEQQVDLMSDRMIRLLSTLSELMNDEPGGTPADNSAVLSKLTNKVRQAIDGRDAYDVIDLLRQHELPMTLTGYRESTDQGIAAIVDVVGLVVADSGRFFHSPQSEPKNDPDYTQMTLGEVIPHISQLGYELLNLAVLQTFSIAHQKDDPSAFLAAELKNAEVMIRAKHYTAISSQIDHAIFNAHSLPELVQQAAGYSLDDVIAVSDAITRLYSDKKHEALESLALLATGESSAADPTLEERRIGQRAVNVLFAEPGDAMSFEAIDVAQLSGISLDRVEAILGSFSIQIDPSRSPKLVHLFCSDGNPSLGKGMLVDDTGRYSILVEAIPHDYIRANLESRIQAKGRAWDQYQLHRGRIAEKLAIQSVTKLLGDHPAVLEGFRFYAGPAGQPELMASTRRASDPWNREWIVENDALFVIEDVAICLEVKAGRISDKARAGNSVRMTADLKRLVTSADSQARRLRTLIEKNGGIWLKSKEWMDLSAVVEVHSIVACLDDLGPLGIAADSMIRSGLLSADTIPWIVSIHDLQVISEVLDMAPDFMLYLRRRTETTSARLFEASDELDLLMLFVRNEFYFYPDPDAVFASHPNSQIPTKNDRRQFRNQPMKRIGTLTDPLDAWMYMRDGTSTLEVTRPKKKLHPYLAKTIAFLADGRKPGWLTAGADLLGLSGGSITELARFERRLLNMAQRDHGFHTLVFTFASLWGYTGIFLAVAGSDVDPRHAIDRLAEYCLLKKYQLRLTRALGILHNEGGEIVFVYYANQKFQADPAMDAEVEARGLAPIQRSRRKAIQKARSQNRKKKGR